MFAKTQFSLNGITAQASMDRLKVRTGAKRNKNIFAFAGIIGSLCKSFMASAIGCKSPNGPTVLGPIRICIAAITRRSAAQMISYEVSIGLVIVTILLCTGSLNLTAIVEAQKQHWFILPLFPMFVIFFISSLAETNRAPFDLPEAEAELVSGFNVEYSSIFFALFFLGEYANMILMSAIASLLFLGGWLPLFNSTPFTYIPGFIWFAAKIAFMLFLFLWVRATLPRYRYDQLMRLGWKVFLPLSLGMVVVVSSWLVYFDKLPRVGN